VSYFALGPEDGELKPLAVDEVAFLVLERRSDDASDTKMSHQ